MTKSINSILDTIEKEVIRINTHTSYKNITIELHQKAINNINLNFMDSIEKISEKYKVKISLNENNKINYEKINIIYNS